MTHPRTEDLLKRINYIEADLEIQKQILFSIPSDQKSEMEKSIRLIASRKKEIVELRNELQKLDPEEYERIITFEKAVAKFNKIAADTPFKAIINRNVYEDCTLALKNGDKVECLIKACDENNNWTIITIEGAIQQFPAAEVIEKPPEKNEYENLAGN